MYESDEHNAINNPSVTPETQKEMCTDGCCWHGSCRRISAAQDTKRNAGTASSSKVSGCLLYLVLQLTCFAVLYHISQWTTFLKNAVPRCLPCLVCCMPGTSSMRHAHGALACGLGLAANKCSNSNPRQRLPARSSFVGCHPWRLSMTSKALIKPQTVSGGPVESHDVKRIHQDC